MAFCDKNETLGKETALQTGTQFHLVDVSDKTALEDCLRKIIEEWGDIDIIINNAGVSQFSPITETSVEDFDKILSINLRPAFVYHLPPISAPSAISRYPQSIRQDYQHLLYPLLDE